MSWSKIKITMPPRRTEYTADANRKNLATAHRAGWLHTITKPTQKLIASEIPYQNNRYSAVHGSSTVNKSAYTHTHTQSLATAHRAGRLHTVTRPFQNLTARQISYQKNRYSAVHGFSTVNRSAQPTPPPLPRASPLPTGLDDCIW